MRSRQKDLFELERLAASIPAEQHKTLMNLIETLLGEAMDTPEKEEGKASDEQNHA